MTESPKQHQFFPVRQKTFVVLIDRAGMTGQRKHMVIIRCHHNIRWHITC